MHINPSSKEQLQSPVCKLSLYVLAVVISEQKFDINTVCQFLLSFPELLLSRQCLIYLRLASHSLCSEGCPSTNTETQRYEHPCQVNVALGRRPGVSTGILLSYSPSPIFKCFPMFSTTGFKPYIELVCTG